MICMKGRRLFSIEIISFMVKAYKYKNMNNDSLLIKNWLDFNYNVLLRGIPLYTLFDKYVLFKLRRECACFLSIESLLLAS